MKERIHVPFKKLSGDELRGVFFADSNKPFESVIHHAFISKTSACTDFHVEIGSIGTSYDDGVASFNYCNRPAFYGRFESKRNDNPTNCVIAKILLQMLHYHYQTAIKPRTPVNRNYKVFMFASSQFFAHVYTEDLDNAIKYLTPMFMRIKCTASTAYKNLELRNAIKMLSKDIKVNIKPIDSKFRLDETYKEIYKHCL